MKILRFVDRLLNRAAGTALVLLFAVMAGLSIIQVLLRFFLNSGIPWGDVAARELVIWVGILGAVLATSEDKHFQIDVLTRFLSKTNQEWFRSFSDLTAGVVCYFLARASLTYMAIDRGETAFLNIPTYIVDLIIPAGFYLMMIQFGFRSIIHAISGRGGGTAIDAAEAR